MSNHLISNSLDVLVVDDYEINRTLLAHLVADFGHRVHEADCGAAAVRMASERHFHIIFMDLRMPGIDGFKAVELIRRTQRTNPRPWIVATTVDTAPPANAKWEEFGIDEVLDKPIRVDAFRIVLDRYFRKARG